MRYRVTLNGKTYEVEVERGEARIESVAEAAAPVAAPVAPAVSAAPAAPTAIASGDPVRAPMPGTILAVKTQAGARVKAGEVLFVLEAMKMENDITAPRDGVVTQVAVAKGQSVETDAVLAVLG